MTIPVTRFRQAYEAALADHLAGPSEHSLRAGYELGRLAVEEDLGVVDLAIVHNDALIWALRGPDRYAPDVAMHAGEFLAEALGAFEMIGRGYRETRDAAELERRHAETLRRLSSFLADASLASDAAGALGEVLLLVAETARELVPAAGCIVAVNSAAGRSRTAASSPARLLATTAAPWDLQLTAVDALLERTGSAVRMGGEELARHPDVAAVPDAAMAGGWLGVPMTALDGTPLGWIQVLGCERGDPTDVDEALVLHLAQMAAATLERTRLYGG